MKQTLQYFRSQRLGIVVIASLAFIGASVEAVTLVLLVPIAQVVGDGSHRWTGHLGPLTLSVTFTQLVIAAGISIIVAAALSFIVAWLRMRIVTRWEQQHRSLVVREFLDADWAHQATDRSGNLQALTNYVSKGSSALNGLISTVKALLTVSTFVCLALVINWRAALVIIATGALLFGVLRPMITKVRRQSRVLAWQIHEYSEELGEASVGARDARVFGASGAIAEKLGAMSTRITAGQFRQGILTNMVAPTYQYGGMLFVLGTLVVANNLVAVNIAEVGAIALLLLRSLSYGQMVQAGYQSMAEAMPYVDHLESARDRYRRHRMVGGSEELPPVETVTLDRVSYSYDGAVDALREVSLTLCQGRIVGIVGPSGSGKSTLSQVLLRLRDPSSGVVLVNDRPATSYTIESWYRRFSLVPQDPKLLHTTVAANIALFDESTPRAEVVEAARMAGVHAIIEDLDDGYDTLVGPAFHDLSGGQIQRIGIARALLRKPDVLVLDEPTSALDVHSEALIQETLDLLRGQTLLVIIAHRLSTLSICDELVVLERGLLTASGSMAEVRESNPFFRKALETGTLDIDRAAG